MKITELPINKTVIDSLSESSFSLENSILDAKAILDELEDQKVVIKGKFDDDLWIFANVNSKGRTINFDFSKLDVYSFNQNLTDNIKTIVKCWISNLLGKYKPLTARLYYYYLLIAFIETQGFHINNVDSFINFLHSKDLKENRKKYLIATIFNFFDYSDLEISDSYLPKIQEVNNKFHYKRNVRKLPPSKDILTFSFFLEKFFSDIKLLEESNQLDLEIKKEKILYLPILIWWKLTNVIPIRSGEFCSIDRDCLKATNTEFFIRLPRRKLRMVNKQNIQILDTIAISKEMYDLINLYINETQKYGPSNTLLSYPAIIWADDQYNHRGRQKRNKNYFNIENFRRLLNKFYLEVINKKYNCNISKENQLSTNDTRHLSFISLMMQGISPVEIARLGGHQTIHAQYHYSFHTEYWIDSEVFKLMTKYKYLQEFYKDNVNQQNQASFIPKEIQLKAFSPPTSTFKGKLEIGFCSDSLQRCDSDDHMYCSHWRIDPKELIEKEEMIKKQLSNKKKHIDDLFSFIQHLHNKILNDEMVRLDINTFGQLKTKANEIQGEIQKIATLQALELKGAVVDE